MPSTTPPQVGPLSDFAGGQAEWRWPFYRHGLRPSTSATDAQALPTALPLLPGLGSACFVEWRYWSVLSVAFHGIVGLSLVNPEQRFASIAEGGLLLIIAGVFDRPAPPGAAHPSHGEQPLFEPPAAELCWMHLFPVAACTFDQPERGGLSADDGDCHLELRQRDATHADLLIESSSGLRLKLTHHGLAGTAIAPVLDDGQADAMSRGMGQRLKRRLAGLIGAHWVVHCPSPVAATDGEIKIDPSALAELPTAPGADADSYATPALRARVDAGDREFRWQRASGYYEHSFGIQPLPLHGWDFLFVPDIERGQSLVMQTYRSSRALRYVEVVWQQDGQARHQRFGPDCLQLTWPETTIDPVLRARRPLRRLIRAEAAGLSLQVDNRVLHRIPLLRPHRLAVRHFFISEEIGVADWTLRDAQDRVIAQAVNQPCGGELAHFRTRTSMATQQHRRPRMTKAKR